MFEALGFKALATTSSGFAFTLGRRDGAVTLDELVAHVEALDRATSLPVSVDLEIPFTFTARAENQIRGNPDLDDTIARLHAFERAGADVLYAPGLRDAAEVEAVCGAVAKPVNVLANPGLSMTEIVAAGARRVSVGGSLAWAAVEAMATVAERIRDEGDFSDLASPARIREWLAG